MTKNLRINRQALSAIWDHCTDFDSKIVHFNGATLGLFMLKTLTSEQVVSDVVIKSLQSGNQKIRTLIDAEQLIGLPSTKMGRTWRDVNVALADGSIVVMLDGEPDCLIVNLTSQLARNITKPELEPSILGPQDSFVEDIHTNLSLVRRRLRTPRMKQEVMRIGSLSSSIAVLIYMQGVTKESLVQELKARLGRIEMDGVQDVHMLTELIGDAPRAIFPTMQSTERPDRVAAALLQGRATIIMDGSPIAILAPTTLVNLI